MADQGVHPAKCGFVDDVSSGKFSNFTSIDRSTWANIVNKAERRRMDTLISHTDRPVKHDGLLCFWFWFLVFGFHYII